MKHIILLLALTLFTTNANAQSTSISMGAAPVTPTGSSTSDSLADWLGELIYGSVVTKVDSYVLVLTDSNKYIRMDKGTAQTLTIPPNVDVEFPIGTEIVFEQSGAGELTIVAGAGVTINPASPMTASGQNAVLVIKKVATDEWTVGGALAVNAAAYSLYGNPTSSAAVPSFTTDPIISGQLTALNVSVNTGGAYKYNNENILTIPQADNASQSTALGIGALQYLSSTPSTFANTAVGYNAIRGSSGAPITGKYNTAFGALSLGPITSGDYNAALGYNSGASITTGSNNIAIGRNSLGFTNSKTGNNNIAIGNGTLESATSAAENVCVGISSCQSMSTGQRNIFLGRSTGFKNTTGGFNTIIGNQVGSATLTTGSNNILIGNTSAVDTPAAATNNWLNIGNLLTGTTTGTKYLSIDGGIGTKAVTADPCGTYPEGSIFYNNTSKYMCYCNGTADVKMSDDTTACF